MLSGKLSPVLAVLVATVVAHGQPRIYVDANATGANNGDSWADAYRYLQDALHEGRQTGVFEIWIADGTYRPDQADVAPGIAPGNRNHTFQLDRSFTLYGGFAGGETALSQRNVAANATILSGDLLGDDLPGFGNRADNSIHVVRVPGGGLVVTVDGLIVRGGNANGLFPDDGGGGAIVFQSELRMRQCVFVDNEAINQGGGIFLISPAARFFASSSFLGNRAGSGGGGAIAAETAGLTLVNDVFVGNFAGSIGGQGAGGAIAAASGSPAIVNCTFAGNTTSAVNPGGGAAISVTSSAAQPVISNCILWGNTDNGSVASAEEEQINRLSGSAPMPIVQHSLVQGLNVFAGSGNIDGNPLLVDLDGADNVSGTLDDDVRLQAGSPAIDAGDDALLPPDTLDLDGDGNTAEATPLDRDFGPRVRCVEVDMGAYETGQATGQVSITCPPDATVECGSDTSPAATGIATAFDTCSLQVLTPTYSDSISSGACNNQVVQVITRTWTAVSGTNQASCTQTITVRDTTAPALSVPADATVECGQSTDPSATGQATATDTCDASVAVTYADTETPGTCPGERVITRTWTATDDCGNTSSAAQTITVQDTTAPTVTPPADTVVECDGYGNPVELAQWVSAATAADACDPAPTISFSQTISSGTCPVVQVVTGTWTATDACGNVSAPATATFTIRDTTAPSITCPPDITIELGPHQCSACNVNLGAPAAGDTCGTVTVSNDAPSVFPAGQTIVTWTATDDCGNSASCPQRVSVVDQSEPFVRCFLCRHLLWPPNHMLVNVGLNVFVRDNCGAGQPVVRVYADEDDETPTGDGTHSPDAKDIASGTLRLRAERKGDGDGRVYLITVEVSDASGNIGRSACAVVVPHSRSLGSIANVLCQAAAALHYFQTNQTPPPGFFLVGDGPVIGPNQ